MLFQIYAPTTEYTDSAVEDFYDLIQLEISMIQRKEVKIFLMGDFNASIGQMISGEENIRGDSSFGNRNSRGSMLLNFVGGLEMKIINSFFKNPNEGKWTWCSPKETKFEIDYIITKHLEMVNKFYIKDDLKFETDHRMIIAELNIENKKQHRRIIQNTPYLKIKKSGENYRENLTDQLNNIPRGKKSVQQYYNEILTCMNKAINIENTMAQQIKLKKVSKKLSEKTKNLIDRREELNRIINKTDQEKEEHKNVRKIARREIRKDINNYEEQAIKQIIEETGSTKKLYKNLAMNKRSYIHNIKHNNQNITDRAEICEAFADFFENIYKSEPGQRNLINIETQQDINCSNIEPNYTDPRTHPNIENEELKITMEEVEKAIKILKNEKSPGEDGITNEIIKEGGQTLNHHLCNLFNRILEEAIIPTQWEITNIILIHKKGQKDQMENYRPISILPNLYKLFTKILQQKIEPLINADQPHEQAGFRPSYSTHDHLQSINQLIEKSQEYKLDLYIGFVDYSKAFDSLETEHIWPSLHRAKIHAKIINVFKTIYKNCKAKISLDKTSRTFALERGVRQGCPSSPNLFNCVLQSIFLELKWKTFGINIEGKNINNLRFADDIVLIAKSIDELKIMFEQLDSQSQLKGLKMNINKTKFMASTEHQFIEVNQNKVEQVKNYVYLGQLIAIEERTEQEIERRRSLAWKKYWSLKKILKSKVSTKLKTKILRTCVFPTLIYGCQTWAPTTSQMNKLKSTQTTMYRSILGIKKRDKIRNSVLHERMKLETLEKTIKRLKLNWAGHVARLDETRWAKQLTKWIPMGRKRKRGRQRKRWEDEISNDCGPSWQITAQNREIWKNKVKIITENEPE